MESPPGRPSRPMLLSRDARCFEAPYIHEATLMKETLLRLTAVRPTHVLLVSALVAEAHAEEIREAEVSAEELLTHFGRYGHVEAVLPSVLGGGRRGAVFVVMAYEADATAALQAARNRACSTSPGVAFSVQAFHPKVRGVEKKRVHEQPSELPDLEITTLDVVSGQYSPEGHLHNSRPVWRRSVPPCGGLGERFLFFGSGNWTISDACQDEQGFVFTAPTEAGLPPEGLWAGSLETCQLRILSLPQASAEPSQLSPLAPEALELLDAPEARADEVSSWHRDISGSSTACTEARGVAWRRCENWTDSDDTPEASPDPEESDSDVAEGSEAARDVSEAAPEPRAKEQEGVSWWFRETSGASTACSEAATTWRRCGAWADGDDDEPRAPPGYGDELDEDSDDAAS